MENAEQNTNSRNNLYFMHRADGYDKRLYANAALFATASLPFDIKYNVSFNYTYTNKDYFKWNNLGGAWSFSRNASAYEYNNLANQFTEVQYSHDYRWTFQTNLQRSTRWAP